MEGSSKSKMDMLDVAPPAVYLPPETMRTFAWLKGVPADSASGEGKKETLRQLVSRQMDSMSIGGLSHMWKASHPLFSFLWAVWSIGCLVLFVMDMNSILRHYFMYPVTISIANQKPSSLEVPAITICPKARVSCRGLAYAVINTSEDELKNISGNLFDKAKCCGAVKNLDEFAEYLNELGCAMDILADGSLFPGFVTTPENLNEEFEELIQQLNVTERRKILVQANNSIVSCTIGDDQCLDWIEHTPTKGIASTPCFTLFGRLEDGAQIPFKILFSGVENGVSLVLKTDLSDYPASGLAEDSGFVVDVHSAFALPDVYSTGFLVAPRTSTRVAITTSKVQRRPHPYKSKCISSWRDTSFHPLLGAEDETFRSSHEKYTQRECADMCISRQLMKECGCFVTGLRINYNVTKGALPGPVPHRAKTFPKCGRRRWKCVEEQMKEADDWIKDCSCQIECESIQYTRSLSSAPFPTPNYEPTFRMNHGFSPSEEPAILQIFFSTLEEEIHSEVPQFKKRPWIPSTMPGHKKVMGVRSLLGSKVLHFLKASTVQKVKITGSRMDVSALFSALGGILGLYLGMSILVLAELAQLFAHVLLWFFRN